jgi:twitching motility protein PilT
MNLADILRFAHEHDASDVHLVAGHPPMMRVDTVVTPMDLPELTPEAMRAFLDSMTNDLQRRQFAEQRDLDFSWEIAGLKRSGAAWRWPCGRSAPRCRRWPT